MDRYEALNEVQVLRHHFHINGGLRLEFLGNLSSLLREYECPVNYEVLNSLVLAVPEEIKNGQQRGQGPRPPKGAGPRPTSGKKRGGGGSGAKKSTKKGASKK